MLLWFNLEPSTQDSDQVAKLSVDIFRPADGLRDLGAQHFAEALPEPVNRHFHRSLRQMELIAYLRVGR